MADPDAIQSFLVFVLCIIVFSILAFMRPRTPRPWPTDAKGNFKKFCDRAMETALRIDEDHSDKEVGLTKLFGHKTSVVYKKFKAIDLTEKASRECVEIHWKFEEDSSQWTICIEDDKPIQIDTGDSTFRNPELTCQQENLLCRVIQNIEASA